MLMAKHADALSKRILPGEYGAGDARLTSERLPSNAISKKSERKLSGQVADAVEN